MPGDPALGGSAGPGSFSLTGSAIGMSEPPEQPICWLIKKPNASPEAKRRAEIFNGTVSHEFKREVEKAFPKGIKVQIL